MSYPSASLAHGCGKASGEVRAERAGLGGGWVERYAGRAEERALAEPSAEVSFPEAGSFLSRSVR
jgi:hypothetical protein